MKRCAGKCWQQNSRHRRCRHRHREEWRHRQGRSMREPAPEVRRCTRLTKVLPSRRSIVSYSCKSTRHDSRVVILDVTQRAGDGAMLELCCCQQLDICLAAVCAGFVHLAITSPSRQLQSHGTPNGGYQPSAYDWRHPAVYSARFSTGHFEGGQADSRSRSASAKRAGFR